MLWIGLLCLGVIIYSEIKKIFACVETEAYKGIAEAVASLMAIIILIFVFYNIKEVSYEASNIINTGVAI